MKRTACVLILSAALFAASGQEAPAAQEKAAAAETPSAREHSVTTDTPVAQNSPIEPAAAAADPAPAANGADGPAPRMAAWFSPLSAGLQIEANMNSPSGYALGVGIAGYWDFSSALTAGVRVLYSNDFDGTQAIELQPLVRFYLFDLFAVRDSSGLFAQADAGVSAFPTDDGIEPFFSGGATAGYRFGFGPWYAEPYVRVGYPVFWGAGIGAGYRF